MAQTHKGKGQHPRSQISSCNKMKFNKLRFRLTQRTAIIRIRTENHSLVTPYLVLLLFAVRPQAEYHEIRA